MKLKWGDPQRRNETKYKGKKNKKERNEGKSKRWKKKLEEMKEEITNAKKTKILK